MKSHAGMEFRNHTVSAGNRTSGSQPSPMVSRLEVAGAACDAVSNCGFALASPSIYLGESERTMGTCNSFRLGIFSDADVFSLLDICFTLII